jgi:hypothetical protein
MGTAAWRAELWLPLLSRFTDLSSTFVVWKQVDSALEGTGDIDAAAAVDDWGLLEQEFRDWASAHGLEPVAVCNHIPGGRNLIAAPDGMSSFLELSLKQNKVFRGSTLFVLDDLAPLSMLDRRGFRRLRPGAEGLFKLVLNGAKWGGRPDVGALEAKYVAALLAEDPEGVRLGARLFGPAEHAVLTLATRVRDGGWDRRAMLRIEAHALTKAVRQPAVLLRRVRFRFLAPQRCPIVKAILFGQRRIPDDRETWWRSVAETHAVFGSPAR